MDKNEEKITIKNNVKNKKETPKKNIKKSSENTKKNIKNQNTKNREKKEEQKDFDEDNEEQDDYDNDNKKQKKEKSNDKTENKDTSSSKPKTSKNESPANMRGRSSASASPSPVNSMPGTGGSVTGTGSLGGGATTGGAAAGGGATAGGAAAGGGATAGGAAAGGGATAGGAAAGGGVAAGGAAAGGGVAAGGAAAGGAAAGGAAAGGAAAAGAGGLLAGGGWVVVVVVVVLLFIILIVNAINKDIVNKDIEATESARESLNEAFKAGLVGGTQEQLDMANSLNDKYLSYLGYTKEQIDYLYNCCIDETNANSERVELIKEYKTRYGYDWDITDAVTVNASREIYKHILYAEKYNFNNIKWMNYSHSQEGSRELSASELGVDSELGIIYPIDPSTSREKFMEMVSPYLLSNTIPLSFLASSITNAEIEGGRPSNSQIWHQMNGGNIDEYDEEASRKSSFAYQILKHGMSDITVDQYQLKHYTLNTYYLDYDSIKYNDSFNVTISINFDGNSLVEFAGNLGAALLPRSAAISGISNFTTNQLTEPEHKNTRWNDNKEEDVMKETYISDNSEYENVYYVSTVKAFDVVKKSSYNYIKYSDEDASKRVGSDSETTSISDYYVVNNENHKVDLNNLNGNTVNELAANYGATVSVVSEDVDWDNSIYTITYNLNCGEYTIDDGNRYDVQRKWDDSVVPGASSTQVFTEDQLYEFNKNEENDDDKETIEESVLSKHADIKYYQDLVGESRLNIIDILDSNPKIYSKYLSTGAEKSDYIGLGKEDHLYVKQGYENIKTYFDKIVENNRLPFIYGISLGYEVETSATGNYMASSQLLKEYIRKLEGGGETTEKDGKLYYTVIGVYDHPTVGYGLDLVKHPEWKQQIMSEMGVNSLEVGDLADVEICDRIEDDFRNSRLETVESQFENLDLKEYQIHALVARMYNYNVDNFEEAYTQYYNPETDDKYEQVYEEYKDNTGAVSEISSKADKNSQLYINFMSKPVTAEGEEGVVTGLVNRRLSEWVLFSLGYYDRLQKFWTAGGDGNFGGISVIDSSGNVDPDACLQLQVAIQNEVFGGTLDAGGIIVGNLWHNAANGVTATRADNTDVDNHLNPAYSDFFAKVYYYQCPWWSRGRASIYLHSVNPDKYNGQSIRDGLGDGVRLASGVSTAYGIPLYTDISQLRANSIISYDTGTKAGHTAYVEAVGNDYYVISHCGSGKKWHGISIVPKTQSVGSARVVGFVCMDDLIAKEQ